MKMSWEMLSNDDANGAITEYEVCYKASKDTTDIDCNLKKMVNDGNMREVTLDRLNEATTYNVAVKAATSEGFGSLGAVSTKKLWERVSDFIPLLTLLCHLAAIWRNILQRCCNNNVAN